MVGNKLAELYVIIKAHDDQLKAGLKGVEDHLKGWAAQVQNLISFRMASAATDLAVKTFDELIKMGDEAIKVDRRLGAVFGEQAEEVTKGAEAMAKAHSKLFEDVKRSATALGTFARAAGFSKEEAAKMSLELTELARRVARQFGESMPEAAEAIAHGAGGMMRGLHRYGVFLHEADLQAELERAGIEPKAATERDKILARIALIQGALGRVVPPGTPGPVTVTEQTAKIRADIQNVLEEPAKRTSTEVGEYMRWSWVGLKAWWNSRSEPTPPHQPGGGMGWWQDEARRAQLAGAARMYPGQLPAPTSEKTQQDQLTELKGIRQALEKTKAPSSGLVLRGRTD